MFILCNSTKQEKVILFYNKPFTVEEFGLTKIEELDFDKENFTFVNSDYNNYPIMSYLDLLLRTMNFKTRTVSHVLSECNIETINELHIEYVRIENKASRLSKSQREKVIFQYNLIKLPDEEAPDTSTPTVPDAPVSTGE